jgi:hypothetical protein
MKTRLFLLMTIAFFSGIQLFAQVKAVKPLVKKTVVSTPTNKITNPQPIKTGNPPPKPTDLQKAVVNIVVGDDGKDYNTFINIYINDGNRRKAADCSEFGNEYFPGENETLPTQLDASVPTGETKLVGALPLPVTKEATLSDFTNGGSIDMVIGTVGNDTWKINSFSVTLYFNNDPGSPHKLTWTGFTLTQDTKTKHLEFDKNFNPIQ